MKGKKMLNRVFAFMLVLVLAASEFAGAGTVYAAETEDILLTEEAVEAAVGLSEETEDKDVIEQDEAALKTAPEELSEEPVLISEEEAASDMRASETEDSVEGIYDDEEEEFTGPVTEYSLDGFSLDPDMAGSYVSVTSAIQLYQLLSTNGDAYIRLDKDIDDMLGNGNIYEDIYYPYWCEMGTGKKVLDLNGHRFSISYNLSVTNSTWEKYAESNKAFAGSTLLKVGSGTSFILHDSEGGGSLHFDGKLTHSEAMWRDVRNILEVTDGGEFIMNGGYLDGGRSKKCWAAGSDGVRSRTRYQIHANGLIAGPGAKITINGGKIEGRGYFYHKHHSEDHYVRCGAINVWDADDQTRIIINDGEFEGDGCAHGIAGVYEGNQECFTIRGGYFYTNYVTYVVDEFDDDENSRECGDANVPLKDLDYKKLNVNIKTRGNIDAATGKTLKFSDNDTTITPNPTFYSYGMTKKDRDSGAESNMNGSATVTYDRQEKCQFRANYSSIWPAGTAAEPYPVGEGAPAHNIYYEWQVFDNSGTKIHPTISKYYYYTDNPYIDADHLLGGIYADRFEDGKTYTVRCYITETYEGQYSYERKAVCEGRLKITEYVPRIDVEYEIVNSGDGIKITPSESMRSMMKEINKDGSDYLASAVITNETTGYEYKHKLVHEGAKNVYTIDASEMSKTKVGAIDIGVEVVVRKQVSGDAYTILTSPGQFKKVKKFGYLPKITCSTDQGSSDQDNTEGSVTVLGNKTIILSTDIKNGYNGTIKWVNTDGDNELAFSTPLNLSATNGGSGYWQTAVTVDGTTYYSPNGFWAKFDPPEVKFTYISSTESTGWITSTTTFSDSEKLYATTKATGTTISDPKFKWSLSSSPDNKVKTRAKNYSVTATYKYGEYSCELPFSQIFASPQDLVDGEYVFSCSFYDGSKFLCNGQRKVNFKVAPDKYVVKGYRNGKDLTDVSGSYIYSADGMPAYIEAGPDPSIFKNEGMYIDHSLIKSDTSEKSLLKSDGKTYGGTLTPYAVDENGVKSVTYKYNHSNVTTTPVNFKILYPLTEYFIDSVTSPVVGQKLSDTKVTVPAGAKYTASVRWLLGSSEVTTERFEADRIYTAVVQIIPNVGVVMPVKFEGNYTYLDNEQVSVRAKFEGESNYRYLTASNVRDGFVSDTSAFTTSPSLLPVSTGDTRSTYQITYMTYPRLKGSDTTYLGRLDINFDTNLAGKGKNAMSFAYDPSEAIDTSAVEFYGPEIKTSGGSDFSGVFEDGRSYTCTLKGIGSKGVYRFADDLSIYVNGQALNRSDYKLNATMNSMVDEVKFGFTVNKNKTPQTVKNLNVSVPAPAAGTEIEAQYGDLVPADPANSPEWSGKYFKDTNNNGKFDAGEDDFTADGDKFVTGNTYGVHVSTYGNDDYVLGEGFKITCNGETKTAAVADDYASADFIFSNLSYTVTFDLNKHGDETKKPEPQTINSGAKAVMPSPNPADPDYKFTGWFKDSACTIIYDFDTPVETEFTLYAGWVENDETTYTVTFDLNGVTGTKVDAQLVKEGDKAAEPETPLTKEKKVFAGWYTKATCNDDEKYDFKSAVTGDITLFAKWVEIKEDDLIVNFDDDEGLIWMGGRYIHYYTSKKITPSVEVSDGYGHTLVKGADYTISYGNNINVDKNGKPAVVTIKGKGNYSSTRKLYFYILPRSIGDGTTINKPADNVKISQTAAGKILVKEGAAAAPIISYGDYQLKSKDYIIIYGNGDKKFTGNDKEEERWITILGRGNFSGSIEQIPVELKTSQYMKEAAVKVSLSKNIDFTYDGEAKVLSEAQLEVKDSKGTKLTKDTDYIVRYIDNVNAGTASVVVTGIGDKTGTVTKKFKIKADTASDVTVSTETPAKDIVYSPGGARPVVKVSVKRGGKDIPLEEGTDYEITYSGNKKVGNKAKYSVKFINNYKGRKAESQGFTINPAPFDVEIIAPDMIYNKPGSYTSAPYVFLKTMDGRNSLLTKNDYTVESYKIGEVDITKEKKYTQADDSVTVSITVKGKGNFAAETVTKAAAYKIRKAAVATKYDLSKAKIVDKNSNKKSVADKEYTGEAIEPPIDVYAKPISGGNEEIINPSLYDVTYINNVEKGNAVILVKAKDDEQVVGSRSAEFKIVARGFAKLFQVMK